MSEQQSPDTPATTSLSRPVRRVVLVGHCGFDQSGLTRAVNQVLPGVAVQAVHDRAELAPHLSPEALLLINRVLDGRFDTGSGVELIGALSTGPTPPRMLLISNYADAQAEARRAGALPGFGKGDLGSDTMAEALRAAAGVAG